MSSAGCQLRAHLARNLKRAVLVAEDSAFWQHDGVDFEQLKESMEANLERMEFARGGSTITQQLAKNLYLSPSKNPIRKLRELLIARRLEAELTEAAHPRAVSERDRVGRRHLRRRSGGAHATSASPPRSSAPQESALLAGGDHQPARARSRASDRAAAPAAADDHAADGRRHAAAGRRGVPRSRSASPRRDAARRAAAVNCPTPGAVPATPSRRSPAAPEAPGRRSRPGGEPASL